jgi:hypothetical protein
MAVALNRLGHCGYVLLFYGQWLLTSGDPDGWLFRLAGECIWFSIGVAMRMNSIWMWGIVGVLIETAGYAKWVTS